MKIWNGYGSEHSSNLKMIGYFADESAAKATEVIFDRLRERVYTELDDNTFDPGVSDSLSDEMGHVLRELNLWSMGPRDIDNFAYDHSVRREGSSLVLTTDENEVGGFLKLMVDQDARIEIFSLHTHDDAGGRKTR